MGDVLELQLPSGIESIEKAADETGEFARRRALGDEMAYAIDMAVRESVANAVKHGNKLDESKSVQVRIEDLDDRVEITVRDFGEGFNVDDVPDPTDPEHLLKTDGRGILFMRSFMDEVEWSESEGGGLTVKMSKVKK
jgi:serine/threonine-protein kinase RsbW